MHTQHAADNHLRELADSLELVPEGDLLAITGWSDETASAYRKRGEGPPWVRLGKHVFYPRTGLRTYIQARVREQRQIPAKGLL